MGKKQISNDLKELIINLWKENNSIRKIARIVKKPHSTVHYVIKAFQKNNSLERPSGSGRPKKINNPQVERKICYLVKKDPKISAVNIAKELKSSKIVDVTPQTVRNFLHSKDLYGYAARKKPLLSKKNVQKRLMYANEFLDKDNAFWETVIFTDESKFNIFGSDGRKFVWRKEGEALNPRNVTHSVKHGGGNVMVWGAMSANGVGNLVFIEGNMNKMDYLNILKNNLVQSAQKMGLGDNFSFVQDNDPKHSALIVKEWLKYNTKKILPHPPQSPDLNPIEHLWSHMKSKLKDYQISSKETLKTALKDIWSSIPGDVTRNLVHSMPRRLLAVKEAKGQYTKY